MKVYYLLPSFSYYFQICENFSEFKSFFIEYLATERKKQIEIKFYSDMESVLAELKSLAMLERAENSAKNHAIIICEIDEKNLEETSILTIKTFNKLLDLSSIKIDAIEYRGYYFNSDKSFQLEPLDIKNIKETYQNPAELLALYRSVPDELTHLWMTDLVFFLKRKECSLDYDIREKGSIRRLFNAFAEFVFPKIRESYNKPFKLTVEDILNLHKIIMGSDDKAAGILKTELNSFPLIRSGLSKAGILQLLKYIRDNPSHKMFIAPLETCPASHRLLEEFQFFTSSNGKITFKDCQEIVNGVIVKWQLGEKTSKRLKEAFLNEIYKICFRDVKLYDPKNKEVYYEILELDVTEFKKLLAESNLQAIWAKDNDEIKEDFQKAFASEDYLHSGNLSKNDKELEKQADQIYNLVVNNLFDAKVRFFAPPPEIAPTILPKIVDKLNKEIKKANTVKEKRNAIKNFSFAFGWLHPFIDGNTRIIYILHHTLRACNKLKPTMLLDPNGFDCLSEKEMEQMELEGLSFMKELQDPTRAKFYVDQYQRNLRFFTGSFYQAEYWSAKADLNDYKKNIDRFKLELMELESFFKLKLTVNILKKYGAFSFWNSLSCSNSFPKQDVEKIKKAYLDATIGKLGWTEAAESIKKEEESCFQNFVNLP